MVIKEGTYKGTRILFDGDARKKMLAINSLTASVMMDGFQPIMIPIIQPESTFNDKVGEENNNMMFTFKDRGNRNLCLAPEYTAVCQHLAKTTFKHDKNVKIFYCQETFRGETPQKGRYRQFTQFGVEILNPTDVKFYTEYLITVAEYLVRSYQENFIVNRDVTRGLDYYTEGQGFEIVCDELGGAKQLCGGGAYEGGIGFAIGVDRLIL